jgi:hypothetical protein
MSDIVPFLTYVRSEYLYSLKEGFGYFSPATVFAVSSCANETLKMQLIADDKVMFPHVPVCALANSKTAPKLTEEECVYAVCPDDVVLATQYEYLTTVESCGVWKKDSTFWQRGIYLFTVEWPKTKHQLHFIELEDGNYIFWANEKITWGDEVPEKLPEY